MSDSSTKTGCRGGGPGRLDPDGVFVVRFRAGSGPREPSGRVECVSSGQRTCFETTDELLAFLLGRAPKGEPPERGS